MNSGNNKPTPEGLTSPASAMNLQRTDSASFDPELMRSLRMHPKLAAWVAGGVLLLLVVFALSRKPTYSAQSLTYVEPQAAKVLSDNSTGAFDAGRYDSYLQQQMQTAIRPDILTSALRRLPPGAFQFPHESDQSAVARLQKQLKVERVLNSYQLSISLQGNDPEAVAATVNAVTNAYLEQGRKDEHETSSQRLQLLTQERQRIQSELAEDRTEQATLSSTLGVANPNGETGNPYDVQLAGVRTQLATARSAHDVALAQLASVRRSAGSAGAGLNAAADDVLQTDPGLAALKATINQRKALLSSQMAGLTPFNPVYKQDQEEMADLDRSLEKQTAQLRQEAAKRVEDKLGLELQRTASVEGMLNAQLAHQTATATGAAPKLQRASELNADITRLTTRFATVDDAIRGLELEANGPGMAHLSVAATVPLQPEPSKRKLLLLLALPLALCLGAGAAVIAHQRDPLVYIERDLQRVLGFPPIGVLPSRDEVASATIEEYMLRLAAGIETAYRVSDARSFVFTGASPSVSVTSLVVALQEKLEELGFTVLITQAPTLLLPHVGGVPMPRLKADAGAGSLELRRSEGHEGYAATNLTMLKRSHDLLLIDAPPLLHSAAAEYAVRSADAAILIAGSGMTLRTELVQAATLLDRLNVAGVGAVLKDLQLKHADPSFKKAIAVLESRWNAQSKDAARVVYAQRAARGGRSSAADTAPTEEPAEEMHPAEDLLEQDDKGPFKQSHFGEDHFQVFDSSEQKQQAEEWDGRLEETKTESQVNAPETESMNEDQHAEGAHSEASALEAADVEESRPETWRRYEAEAETDATNHKAGASSPGELPAQQAAGAGELEDRGEVAAMNEETRPVLVFEPEDEPSERARLWLERLLNPNATRAVSGEQAVEQVPAHDEERGSLPEAEPMLPVADAHKVVPQATAAVEAEPVKSPIQEAEIAYDRVLGDMYQADPVAEADSEQEAMAEAEELAGRKVSDTPEAEEQVPAASVARSYPVVVMYPPRAAAPEPDAVEEEEVENAQEEYPIFHEHHAAHSATHARPEIEQEIQGHGQTYAAAPGHVRAAEPIVSEAEPVEDFAWPSAAHLARSSAPVLLDEEEVIGHDRSASGAEADVARVDLQESTARLMDHAGAEGTDAWPSMEEEQGQKLVTSVAVPLRGLNDETGSGIEASEVTEAAQEESVTEHEHVTAQEPEPLVRSVDHLESVRRAALLREAAAKSFLAKLPTRDEGSIQPETGRMSRKWGMLSRFGGESATTGETESIPEGQSRR